MPNNPIVEHKANLITQAIERHSISSIMDVGACWGVHAGYAFHALAHGAKKAVVLDGLITEKTKERAANYDDVSLIQMSLSDREKVASLEKVDAVILFDVLLHQVNPNWDEFLKIYAAKADALIIYNQNFVGKDTIRFIELGKQWYKKQGFYRSDEDIDAWFAIHDEFNQEQNKPQRDIHNFWQWGITAPDIIRVAEEAGFYPDYFYNHGNMGLLPYIECHSFIFKRIS